MLWQNARRVMRTVGLQGLDHVPMGVCEGDAKVEQWQAPPPGNRRGVSSLDRGAEAGKGEAQVAVQALRQARGDCGRLGAGSGAGRADLTTGRARGAWRNARRPTAGQPKKRLTRSRITPDMCWISIAAGLPPAAPGSRSGLCPALRARPYSFTGWECSATSGPAISFQRVTISAEAKPWRLSTSLKSRAERTRKAAGENCARACSSRIFQGA